MAGSASNRGVSPNTDFGAAGGQFRRTVQTGSSGRPPTRAAPAVWENGFLNGVAHTGRIAVPLPTGWSSQVRKDTVPRPPRSCHHLLSSEGMFGTAGHSRRVVRGVIRVPNAGPHSTAWQSLLLGSGNINVGNDGVVAKVKAGDAVRARFSDGVALDPRLHQIAL